MKFKTIIFGLGIALGGMVTSCNDDFLDRPSEDQVEAPYFFNTAKDLEVATNDFYRAFSKDSKENDWTGNYTEDAGSDNLMPLNPSARVRGSRVVPVARGSGGWNWDDLRKINYFLNNYHKVKDEAAKAKYGGVARFFRAYFYYDKVKTFGDVPWYSGVLDAKDPQLYKARDSRSLVMDSVMADLDFAIANMPTEKQVNLITKYTAMLLKARVALFEGTFRKYHGMEDADKYLTLAAAAAQDLITSNAYTLYTEGGVEKAYRNLFARNNQDNIETILAIDFELGLKVHSLGSSFTSDLLNDMPTSYTTGFSSYLTNIGSMRNTGVEVDISADILRDKALSWTTSLNIGMNKNKTVALADGSTELRNGTLIHRVGQPWYTYYLAEFAGINKETGVPQYYINDPSKPGSRDITEDANEANRIAYKSVDPKLTGGFTNTFRYKFMDLNFTWTYTLGGYSYDSGASKTELAGKTGYDNIPKYYERRWQKPGDETDIEMFMVGNSYDMSSVANTRRVHSTDHIRLKNLTFGVAVPQEFARRLKVSNIRAYCSGVNLLTFAAYKNYDPEIPNGGSVYFESPKLKTVTFGLDIKF